MAKRFSDTDKWKKPFIRSLQAPYKLLWLYILDDCDHAGVWQVDMEIANIKIGENLNTETALKQFGDKITVFDSGEKWFIKDFIDFQYGELNPKNRVHESVLSILKKYNLILENKHLTSPLQGAKDKDKDKDKDNCIISSENFENFFFVKDEKIEGGCVDWFLKNQRNIFESELMKNQISKHENSIIAELNKLFPNGSLFNDYSHITNSMRKKIKDMKQSFNPTLVR
jgi:hypothetical protein